MYLITYDIVEDKHRVRVSKLLEDYGVRVQFSVFESDMDLDELELVLKKLKKIIDPTTDNVKVYALCTNCQKKVLSLGLDKSYTIPGVMVV